MCHAYIFHFNITFLQAAIQVSICDRAKKCCQSKVYKSMFVEKVQSLRSQWGEKILIDSIKQC